MNEFDAVLVLLVLLPRDDELVLLGRDIDLVTGKSGHRQSNAVAIVAGANDIEGWEAFLRIGAEAVLERVEQAVKSDSRASIRTQVKCSSHFQILLVEQSGRERRRTERAGALCPTGPILGVRHIYN